MNESDACPCCSGTIYTNCCGPYLGGKAPAPTAEALMRSRFSAHVHVATAYLVRTVAADRRHLHAPKDVEAWAAAMQWLRLEVLATEAGGPEDATGIVEFRAWYRDQKGRLQGMHERSRFHREAGQWRYIDGTQPRRGWRKTISRNDPCPCGSGHKFKKCCA